MFCKILKTFGLIPNIPVVKNAFVVRRETIHHEGDDFDNKLPTNKNSSHDDKCYSNKAGLITFLHFN